MDIAVIASLIMVASLVIMLVMGMPIGIGIGVSSTLAMIAILPFDSGLMTCAQKMFTGINSFPLMAIPFFILAGNIMNNGGIATKLVNCAKLLTGKLPAPLAQTNILANMMFGSISGSGTAAAAAIGGTMSPIMVKEGYSKDFIAAVNIASAPTGQLIPPSNTLIVYATVAGSVSVAALFMAGYIPGILWGLAIMVIAGFMGIKRGYKGAYKVPFPVAMKIILDALPSIFMIVIIIGGILAGVFTATEAAAVSVAYVLLLSACYRTIKLKDLPKIFIDSAITTTIVLFMIGVSSIMSWVMAYTMIPTYIANAVLDISENPIVILLLINIILLLVGTFMDPTPAVLIFTPIFLPICQSFGMDPVHFGIMMVFNLCIGTITPPVGVILFTGCRVTGINIEKVIKTLIPYFIGIFVILMLTTYVEPFSMAIPRALGLV